MIAVAARRYWLGTWLSCGARPIAAPPLDMSTFRPGMIEGHRLVYIVLHGLPGDPYYYGDEQGLSCTVTAEQLATANLSGSIVLAMGCHAIGPMSEALLKAGAAAVFGSPAKTYADMLLPRGTNALGRFILRRIHQGWDLDQCLWLAWGDFDRTHPTDRERQGIDEMVLLRRGR